LTEDYVDKVVKILNEGIKKWLKKKLKTYLLGQLYL
jgi:hypothetical protein